MGFSPRDINDMSLWEFEACLRQWLMQHKDKSKAPAPSDDLLAALGIDDDEGIIQ